MAKYQKYVEYKDSGVEWLGKIPSHWRLFALKRSVDKCTNGFWGAEPDGVNDLCVLRVADFNRDNFEINLDKLTYRSVLPKEAESRLLKNGDLLIEKSGGGEKTLVGCVVQFDKDFPAITSNFVAKMTPNCNMDSRFLTYSFAHLYAGRVNYPAIKQTTGIQNLDSEAYLMENFCFPPAIEQTQIALFLDHETAKIDSLIAKQEKLIELLKEKLQAVISHAVTKGLNPDVEMKNSGVEWLGKVPEHWDVRQLRFLGTCQNGINIGAEYFGSGSPFISYGDVYRNPQLPKVFEGLVQSTENDRKLYSIKRGDVLFTRTSETIEEIGFSSASLGDVENATFAGFLIRFRPKQETLLPEYSRFYFRNLLLRAFFVKEMNLVTRASLSQELLKKLPVTLPSLNEQKQIADFLSQKDQIFEKLIQNSIVQISLLKERRTALISSAVTGKIDVRNWQNPNNNNNEAKTEFSV